MGGGAVVTAGMAAVDIALWDIRGKALSVPVYQLLGGKTNRELRCYASQLQFGWGPEAWGSTMKFLNAPEEYAAAVKAAAADGYDAVKIDPVYVDRFGNGHFNELGNHIRGAFRQPDLVLSAERIAAAREAGGPDMDIIIEIHSLLDTNTAIELGRALEPYRIFYYEEPTQPLNPALFKEIHRGTTLPLATGERSYTRWGFRPFFEDRSISVVQPDTCNTGGITECKKICDMAHVYDIAVQLHVCGGPIATAAALQIEAVIPNFLIHEQHIFAYRKQCIDAGKYDYQPVNGKFYTPDLPGIGQEMSESEMASAEKVVIS
jgi:L-alanine-DL-glutamate epimerase-like enolase superfamily enzyme